MSANQARFRVATMARVLGVSTSGYYAWRQRPPSVRAQADANLTARVRAIHADSRGTYGAPRIHAELAEAGVAVGRKRVYTYVPTLVGFLYLAIVLDVFSRRVVGWAMAAHLRTELVVEALEMAVAQRRPEAVIHHSDQGCQYTSLAFGARCREWGVAL